MGEEVKMTAKFEIVKLVDAEAWPAHNNFPPPEKKSWGKWRGKEIAIGEAVRPRRDCWNCDTEAVYPVTDETLARMGFKPEFYGSMFVCEHQIERGPTA